MLKIAIGGLKKNEIEQAVKNAGKDLVETIVTTDIQAAQMIKNKTVDYYFGACNSGGGAAISILIGMLGYSNCCTVAMAGKKVSEDKIKEFVNSGKLAYGMAVESISDIAPVLVKLLLEKHGLN